MRRKEYSLLLVTAGRVVKRLVLGKGAYTIGRADDTDLTLSSHDVSRHHARIRGDGGRYTLEDLKSTNGTYVNGQKVERHRLNSGDEISIGEYSILFDDGIRSHLFIEETEVARRGEDTEIISDKFSTLRKKIDDKTLRREFKDIESFVRKSRKRLATLANADNVTGLYNRQYFDKTAAQEFEKARVSRKRFSILFIDLDHFKRINDQYGHKTGDGVLRAVSWLIQKSCRKTDFVARYGGEEIVVVLPNTASADAARIGEEIREIIEKQTKNRLGVAITVSVGVATFPEDGKSLAMIIERADQALYQAKKAGRNRVCKYHA